MTVSIDILMNITIMQSLKQFMETVMKLATLTMMMVLATSASAQMYQYEQQVGHVGIEAHGKRGGVSISLPITQTVTAIQSSHEYGSPVYHQPTQHQPMYYDNQQTTYHEQYRQDVLNSLRCSSALAQKLGRCM